MGRLSGQFGASSSQFGTSPPMPMYSQGPSSLYSQGPSSPAHALFTNADCMGYYGTTSSSAFPDSHPSVLGSYGSPSMGTFSYGLSQNTAGFPFSGYATPQINSVASTSGHNSSTPSGPWYFDSRATSHVTPDATQISVPTAGLGADHVTVGNGQHVAVSNSGIGILPIHSILIIYCMSLKSLIIFSQFISLLLITTVQSLLIHVDMWFRTRTLIKFCTRGPVSFLCPLKSTDLIMEVNFLTS